MSTTAPAVHLSRTAPDRLFRPDIEGLRAVAVALVVLHDAGVPGLAGGYIGIDVFFVISGFLITSLLLRELDDLSLPHFYARRARRILPASCLVLIATVAASYHWLGYARGDAAARFSAWTALLAADARPGPTPLQHFWSLAVAEQFSVVWPALIALLLWLGLRHCLPLVLTFLTAGSFAYAIWQGTYYSPVTRAWELGAGCLLALVADRLDRIPARVGVAMAGLGLALIVLAALSFTPQTRFPGYAASLPVVGAVLVLAGRGDALLALPPLRILGQLSYPLYLWHWPVLTIAAAAYGPLTAATRALLVLASLGLAAITYLCLERPIRRSRSEPLMFGVAFAFTALPLAVARYCLTVHAHL